LVELIEKDFDFKELKEFEGSFEQDELWNIFFFGRIDLIFIKMFFWKKNTIHEIIEYLIFVV
jgi:hypothetical protein